MSAIELRRAGGGWTLLVDGHQITKVTGVKLDPMDSRAWPTVTVTLHPDSFVVVDEDGERQRRLDDMPGVAFEVP